MDIAKDGDLAVRVELDIVGITPLSFGKAFASVRNPNEGYDVFENRCWRERMHVDEQGQVFVPPLMFKRALEAAARYAQESVPGKRTTKFTKHFLAGTLVADPILIGVKVEQVVCERLFVAADGKPGGKGGKVWRNFPLIPKWSGRVIVHLLDPVLQQHWIKVIEYAERAGDFIGLGRFAPRVGGFYGRFRVQKAVAIKK
jgi:hypothetical protein